MAISSFEIEEALTNKITRCIRDNFTNTEVLAVYNDQTPQHFTKPCIVVLEYDTQEEHLGNNRSRYYVWYDILIHIEFNETTYKGIYSTMRKWAWKLERLLNYITLEPQYNNNTMTIKLRKHEWRAFVKEGVGHCMVRYDYVGSKNPITPSTPITSVFGDVEMEKEK